MRRDEPGEKPPGTNTADTRDAWQSISVSASDTQPDGPRALTTKEPGTHLGRYEIRDRLGAGGMSVVYSAYDPGLDRKVAVKLLRTSRGSDGVAGQRLQREAQALARLSHPNVVTVHEVDMMDGELFIAMELVEGTPLNQWCRQDGRSWQEVLAMYLHAAEGLAAAHRAGIVHRDFKPANVIVGTDGRVRVLDFGLAAAVGARTPEDAALSPPAATRSGNSLDRQLTGTGSLMGTPAYMAPEQHRGAPADERSDQFAFCVSLYEGLYGERPFPGETIFELAKAKAEGAVPPAARPVPAWLRTAVIRGLAPLPSDRWPNMQALIAALRDDPAARRRRVRNLALGALLLAGLAGLAVVGWLRKPDPAAACAPGPSELAGAWDDAARERMRAAFAATGLPYASAGFERVAAILDQYAAGWMAMRAAACEATHVRRQQPESVLALRMHCLDRRRSQLAALVTLLSDNIDADVMERSADSALALAPVTQCGDVEALLAAVPLPADPAVRSRVAELDRRLDRASALMDAGKYREGLDEALAVVAEARAMDHAPLAARAMLLAGDLRLETGEAPGAEAVLREALPMAARARDDALVAQSWSSLLQSLNAQARFDEAPDVQLAALTAAARAGDDLVRADVLDSVGEILAERGRWDEARGHIERALAIREQLLPPGHHLVGRSLNNLGTLLWRTGAYAEARARLERALAIQEQALGADHPAVAMQYDNLAVVMQEMGAYAEARAPLERALAIRLAALGPEHPQVAVSMNNLGVLLTHVAAYGEARTHLERALALEEKLLGPEHPQVARFADNLGAVLQATGASAEARVQFERALAIREKALGPEHPDVAESHSNLGVVLWRMGSYGEARAHYERALAIAEKALSPEHPTVAVYADNLGVLLKDMGAWAEARALCERALAIREKALDPEHPDVGISHGNLGVLLSKMEEHQAARAHFERALAILEKTLGPEHPRVAQITDNFGALLRDMGAHAEARAQHERSLAIHEKVLGADSAQAASSLLNLGLVLERTGQSELARERYERALAIWERTLGAEHVKLADPLTRLGSLMLGGKQPRQALPLLQRAVALLEAASGDPVELARSRFVLAQALWETGERERATALITQACDVFAALERARDLAEMARWLRPRGLAGKHARCASR
jgi:tetratricopeptide (TPR) repeat protein/tRNA A-37 threonylcarbamoyl transferase component Bud32